VYYIRNSIKGVILSLFFVVATAFAQVAPIDVSNECVRQMSMGICLATPDRASISPGQTMLIAGVGRVQYSAYLDYMDKYNPAMPSDPAMCDLALDYMSTNPGGDHDKVARALWTPVPQAEPAMRYSEVSTKVAVGMGAALMAFIGLRKRTKKVINGN
jgi:hypothetical protein